MEVFSPDNSNNFPLGIPLSRYTAAITNAVSTAEGLAGVWVIAELSDVRVAGGHCYMELIEKNEFGQTVAKLRANIWRTTYNQLRQKFYNATQREITTGIKALVRGSATHHSLYGLSFNIFDIDPSYTMGDMERLRKEILMRLHKEGILNNNKKLKLPLAPQKIAVISAEGAAGYGDFINQLVNNSEGFVFYPCLFPSVMQGDKVSESIRYSLEIIESSAHLWDCVAIVRGGGATTDLNGFDDYELAKAVACFGLPVIVGIGHDRDRNVLDDVANVSVKTPTAVASFFIDQMRMAYEQMIGYADKIRIYSSDLIRGEERRLNTIHGMVPQLALRRLEDTKSRLSTVSGKLPLVVKGSLNNEQVKLSGVLTLLSGLSSSRIAKERTGLDSAIRILSTLSQTGFNNARNKIESIEKMIHALDPKNTLKRGYSITRINGKTVKSVSELSKGATITTSFVDGEKRSVVNE